MRPAAYAAIVFALFTLFLPTPALAQSGLTATVEFGYDGIIVAERWAPVRFILTQHDEPVSGTLTIRYQQDASQDASVTARFSLTPGVPTPVDLTACFQRFTRSMSVVVRSDAGRTLLAENLDFDNPKRALDLPFRPPLFIESSSILLSVGIESLADSASAWAAVVINRDGPFTEASSEPPPPIAQRMTISSREPGRMFSSWTAYNGIGAMVVRASDFGVFPERARRAILLWQSGGGHLIVLVDDASNAWSQWLGRGDSAPGIAIDEPRSVTAPAAFAGFPAYATLSTLGAEEIAEPARTINARAITLGPDASARGWRTRFDPPDGSPPLAASGPAGLGTVTILGFDPTRATALRSRNAAAIAWAAVLDRFITEPFAGGDDLRRYQSASGATEDEQRAIDTLINAGVEGEGIGFGALLAVLAVLVAFIVAIGPLDAIVLRRLRLRHWAWLSALCWVALASVLAVQIPSLTVGGQTQLSRLAITDAVLDTRADPVASWTTALTALYAGKTGAVGPDDARPGVAWRGVSPLEMWQYNSRRATSALGPLRLVHRPEIAPGGARDTVTPLALSQRGWTARALLDISPDAPPLAARLAPTAGGHRLELLAAAPETRIIAASIIIRDRRWVLHEPATASPIELAEAEGAVLARASARSLDWIGNPGPIHYGPLAALPGAIAREHALDALTSDPSCALIEIVYTGSTPPFEVYGTDTVTIHGVVRLAVPIAKPNTEPNP